MLPIGKICPRAVEHQKKLRFFERFPELLRIEDMGRVRHKRKSRESSDKMSLRSRRKAVSPLATAKGTSGIERITTVSVDIGLQLSDTEKENFEECEKMLGLGARTFSEVGAALLRIREGRLFRATHSTFQSYCRERWGISRSYAWRVIGAAERLRLLSSSEASSKPTKESQIRPFLKLEPDDFPRIWQLATKRAKGGKVTAKLAETVIAELNPVSAGPPSTVRLEKWKSRSKIPVGQLLVLLDDAKRKVAKGAAEDALNVLERIESILLG
jgi:hypothetical protein